MNGMTGLNGAAAGGMAPPMGAPPAAGGGQDLGAMMDQWLQQNPELAQQFGQYVSAAAEQGFFDNISAEMLPQIGELVRLAIEQPEAWPDIRAAAIQLGMSEQDLPPNMAPDQVRQFAQSVLLLLHVMGKGGGQQGGASPGGEQAPIGLAFGGQVPYPSFSGEGSSLLGLPPSDTVPAQLTPGEYVMNPGAVQAMGGPQALDAVNFAASGVPPGPQYAQAPISRAGMDPYAQALQQSGGMALPSPGVQAPAGRQMSQTEFSNAGGGKPPVDEATRARKLKEADANRPPPKKRGQ